MAEQVNLSLPRSRDGEIQLGPVEVEGSPVDLAAPGTKLWFTAKLRKSDAYEAAVIRKTYVAGGPSVGITVAVVAGNSFAYVQIDRADTEVLETATLLAWDCLLETPAAGRETIAYGTLKVRLSVSDPP